jgi:hypothetical protein
MWRLLTDVVVGNWTHGANEGNDGGGGQYWPLGQRFVRGALVVCRRICIPTLTMLNCKVLCEQADTAKYHCSALASMPWVGSRTRHFLNARRIEPFSQVLIFYHFLPATTFAGIGFVRARAPHRRSHSHRGDAKGKFSSCPGKPMDSRTLANRHARRACGNPSPV